MAEAKKGGKGKIVLIIVVVLIVLAAIGACSGGSKPSDSSSSSATKSVASVNANSAISGAGAVHYAELPDKNGFDEATNQIVNVLGVDFSFPSYFQESSSADGKVTYSVPPEDGVSENVVAVCVNNPSNKAASVEKFQANMESSLLSLFKTNAYKDVRIVDSAEGGIAGLPSDIYTLTGNYVTGSGSSRFTARAGCFLNNGLEIGCVIFMQIDETAKHNYFPDFDKILASATVIEQPPAEEASDGVSPDLKEALDSYEAFVDEYIEFMQKYKNSNDMTSMMSDYLSYMQKYSELVAKIDAMDTKNMSTADAAYYLEVTSRVSQKLLNAAV